PPAGGARGAALVFHGPRDGGLGGVADEVLGRRRERGDHQVGRGGALYLDRHLGDVGAAAAVADRVAEAVDAGEVVARRVRQGGAADVDRHGAAGAAGVHRLDGQRAAVNVGVVGEHVDDNRGGRERGGAVG